MAMAALGGAMMRGGAKVAGSSAAKSQAGRILASKDLDSLTKMVDGIKLSNKHLGSIKDNTKKSAGLIALYSPALKQQMIVLKRSFELFLRPIGDIIAKFIRPAAIWGMKVARMWYKLLSPIRSLKNLFNPFSGGVDTQKKEDELKQIDKELETAIEEGDTDRIAKLQKERDEITNIWDKIGSYVKEKASGMWNFVKTAWSDGGEWVKTKSAEAMEYAKIKWEQLKIAVPIVAEVIKTKSVEKWNKMKELLTEKIELIKEKITETWNMITEKTEEMKTALFEKYEELKEKLKKFFTETIPGWFENMIAKFQAAYNKIASIIESAKSKASSIVSKVKSTASSLWDTTKDVLGIKASGGIINETGPYELHAGEKVVNAGDNRRSEGGSSNIVNNFTINAKISNDIDIRALAGKLARYQESEIRRRISY